MEKLKQRSFLKNIFSRELRNGGLVSAIEKLFLMTIMTKKMSVAKCKTAQMENDAVTRVVSEYCGTDVKLTDILKNRVTDECLAVFNTTGTMVKTQKSK